MNVKQIYLQNSTIETVWWIFDGMLIKYNKYFIMSNNNSNKKVPDLSGIEQLDYLNSLSIY